MPRQPYSDRKTIEDCLELSIKKGLNIFLKSKDDCLKGFIHYSNGYKISVMVNKINNSIILNYSGNEYLLELVKKPCFEGYRYYITCPACRNSFLNLYMPFGDNVFLCRNCHNLIYEVQKKHNKRLDAYKDFKLSCNIENFLFSGKVKERNKAKKLLRNN